MPSIKVRGLPPPQDHEHTGAGDGGALGSDVVDTPQIKAGALSADAAGRGKMADGFLEDAKVAAAAGITKSKLAALGIVDTDVDHLSGAKLDDDSVALAKVEADIKTFLYHGDEIEVSVTGTTEEQVKDMAIILGTTPGGMAVKTLKIVARLKTSLTTAQASFKVYHDSGAGEDLELTSTSESYEEKTGNIDVSAWGDGRHTLEFKLVSATAGETAFDELLEIYGVQ